MGLDTYFRVTSYAMVATAFMGLALTGELDALSILLYPIALGASFYADAREVPWLRLPDWMWRTLAAAYVPFVVVDAVLLSNKILALVHMTLFVSGAKLLQAKRDRDWVFLYLVGFFQMLLAAGLTFDTTFIVSLLLFIFFFVSTLAAFEIRRARREIVSSGEEIITPRKKPRRVKYRAKGKGRAHAAQVRYLVGASIAQVAIVAALTLPFFFMIPRFGGGVGRGFGGGAAHTGFSEKVSLGAVASIKESQRVVMRVHLDRKPAHMLRWRGVALEHYRDHTWTVVKRADRQQPYTQSINFGGANPGDSVKFVPNYQLGNKPDDPESLVEQRILLEPLDTTILFAAQNPISLRVPVSAIFRDRHTGAISVQALRGRTDYTVQSDIHVPGEQELRADLTGSYPDHIKELYLQKPQELDPRIRHLAEDITRRANARAPYDKARAIENYLKTEFKYWLGAKPTKGDPLAEFLFDTREGHCEYFATAMAIMLRTLEIPARIVNGFQMGEYNDVSDFYTVRERDAHSWVEVYFPRTDRWVEFDPTPAAGLNDYSQGGWLASLKKYLEAAEVLWMDYVVTLDSDEQASIMIELQQKLRALKDRVYGYYLDAKLWVKNAANWMIVDRDWSAASLINLGIAIVILALSLVSLYVAVSYIKRRRLAPTGYEPWWYRLFVMPTWRRTRLTRRDYRTSAVLFYEQMLAIAGRAGLVKPSDQTPVEFAASSEIPQIHEITAIYNRVRFGGASLGPSEARRVSILLTELKKALRQLKGDSKG